MQTLTLPPLRRGVVSPTKRSTKSREQLTLENDFLRRGGWASQVGPTVRVFFWCSTVILLGYFAKEAVIGVAHELAGKDTKADILYKLLSDISVSIWLAWGVGAAGAAAAVRERRLRKRTVERLSRRNAELEGIIDSGRTSSELTASGDTNPEDR